MTQLSVAFVPVDHPSVLERKRHRCVLHPGHLGRLAVDEPEAVVVSRPADAVALAKLEVFRPVHLHPAGSCGELVRHPGDERPVPPSFALRFTVPVSRSIPATRNSSPFSTPSRL